MTLNICYFKFNYWLSQFVQFQLFKLAEQIPLIIRLKQKFKFELEENNEISNLYFMKHSLIYPCLVDLMKIINIQQKQSPSKQFYHAHLLLDHFIHARQTLQQKNVIYQNLLRYYQQRWILDQEDQLLDSESCMFLKQIQRLQYNERMVCQIVARILILAIKACINKDSEKEQIRAIINLCQELHLRLVFEGISISRVLLQFIQKITSEIKVLVFYENLLKIFVKLDIYQIVISLQTSITKIRQEWNKTQIEIQKNITNINTITQKRNHSIEKNDKLKEKEKQNNNIQPNAQSEKSVQKTQKQSHSTNFKITKATSNIPQSIRRRTMNRGNGYTFNNRNPTSDLFSSTQIASFEEKDKRIQQKINYQIPLMYTIPMMYNKSQKVVDPIQNEADGILANSTPKKKKTNKKV